MATVEDLPAAVAAAPPPPGAAAAAPPVVLIVDQRINSSSGKLVQLSRQDSQYTDKEKGRTSNPAYDSTVLGSRRHLDFILDPTSQITSNLRVVDDMPETDDAESQAKLDALVNYYRQRGARLREAPRRLPDGGWVNRDAVPEDRRSNPESWRETAPSTNSITLADINRRETNAFSKLGQRRWDTRWSYNFNIKRFLRMLSSHFKHDMMKYPSYDAYIREYVGFHYLIEHFSVGEPLFRLLARNI